MIKTYDEAFEKLKVMEAGIVVISAGIKVMRRGIEELEAFQRPAKPAKRRGSNVIEFPGRKAVNHG